MKVTIEFENTQNLNEKEVRYLLIDALYEFVSHRGPSAEEYVNKRYPNNSDYSWLNREYKIKQVNRRIICAQEMYSNRITIE